MSDIPNPSYDTTLKRQQKIYEQNKTNKRDIVSNQPDMSKVHLDPNWLQNIATIHDSGDQPLSAVGTGTLIRDITAYNTNFIPISSNINPGPAPATANFSYTAPLPGIKQVHLPYLEIRQTFDAGALDVRAGYIWSNLDVYLTTFTVTAAGNPIWTGENPPIGSSVVISKLQADNGYAAYTVPAWDLQWKSTTGGVYGGPSLNTTSAAVLMGIYDQNNNVWIPITADVISTLQPSPTGSYAFYVYSQSLQLNFALQWSLIQDVVLVPFTDGFLALWFDPTLTQNTVPFYFYEAVLSGGNIDFYVFPPGPQEMTNPLNPVVVTINQDGPVKYSDVIASVDANAKIDQFISARATNDPFFFKTSQSTDAKEVWEAHLASGVVVVTQATSDDIDFPVYNDTYTWTLQSGEGYSWVRDAHHTTITKQQYFAPNTDLTSRVVVTCRPPNNWKQTTKFQS